LDDNSIISHLETLKKEAAEVAKKVEETDIVMAEVETLSQQYVPLTELPQDTDNFFTLCCIEYTSP
jgi:dynein heavy chain 1